VLVFHWVVVIRKVRVSVVTAALFVVRYGFCLFNMRATNHVTSPLRTLKNLYLL